MKKKLVATQTPNPQDVPLSKPIPTIDSERRVAIGSVLGNLIDINLGNRAALDQNLDVWNAILEMRSMRMNLPYEGASHITTPTVFTAYNEFCSRTIGSCLQPRPYTARGEDPISAQYSHSVEQFHNAEWDKNNCFDAYEDAIRFGARDGTVVMEVLYDLSTHEERYVTDEPTYDNEGNPVLDAFGDPVTEKVVKIVKFVDYDAPREVPIDLKSFLWLPNFAKSINDAPGVARKVWLSESDMQKKVAAGYFDQETVDAIIQYASDGSGEQGMDPQGNSQYTISGMINVVDTPLSSPDGVTMDRGPYLFWRIHTNLLDLDGDDVPEENIIWLHWSSRKVPGFVPYDYFGGRPFFDLAMIPRPGVPYGWGIPEIGRASQEEVDTQTNARLNLIDMAVRPPRRRTQGVRYRTPNGTTDKWDLDVEVEVTKADDFGFIDPPRVPQESFQAEEKIQAQLDRALGAPQAPASSPPIGGTQQRSARAAAFQAQMVAMNSNLVNTRVRRWMLRIYKFKHGLYLRYGKNQLQTVQQTQSGPQSLTLPKEVLGLKYHLGITGLGGALDKEQRRQDMTMLVQALLGTPLSALFQGKLSRLWNLARMLIETYDVPDVTTFIGTLDEATQQEEANQQAAVGNMQAQALMQLLSHMSSKGGGRGGLTALPGGKTA